MTMQTSRDFVGTEEAARLLGVTVRRVQQLIRAGVLASPARGLVHRASLDRLMASHAYGAGRGWSSATSWAALAMVSGVEVTWLGERQRLRLLSALRGISTDEFLGKVRARGRVHYFNGHSSIANRLSAALVSPDRSRLGLAGATGLDPSVDGYLDTTVLDKLVPKFALVEEPHGQYVLRVTDFDIGLIRDINDQSEVLAAVDAAESLDARERGVGEAALTRALEQLHD